MTVTVVPVDVKGRRSIDDHSQLLVGRHILLRPLTAKDPPALYEIACSDSVARRWRFQGLLPTYEAFVGALDQGVFVQYVVSTKTKHRTCGMVTAYNSNLKDRYCFVAGFADKLAQRGGLGVESFLTFLRYLFLTVDYRKIYIEAPGYSLPQYKSTVDKGVLTEEGRLREHYFLDGQYWDQYILAAYPDPIMALAERLLKR